MTLTTIARRLGAGIVITAAAAVSLTACGDYTPPGELGENQRILGTCPKDQKLNQTLFLDMSVTSLSEQIKTERLGIVGQLARRTAVCGGHLSVTAFSSGSAATVALYNGDLDPDGATTEGRLNRVPAMVEEVVDEISAKYDEAAPQLPTDGTDVAGMYRLAHESQQQLGDGYRLEITILTDGLQNLGGVVLDQEALSTDQAQALADQVAVPDLSGAEITVAGLGRIADAAVPSALVEGLVDFYDRLCTNAGAATCTSVTDWR